MCALLTMLSCRYTSPLAELGPRDLVSSSAEQRAPDRAATLAVIIGSLWRRALTGRSRSVHPFLGNCVCCLKFAGSRLLSHLRVHSQYSSAPPCPRLCFRLLLLLFDSLAALR